MGIGRTPDQAGVEKRAPFLGAVRGPRSTVFCVSLSKSDSKIVRDCMARDCVGQSEFFRVLLHQGLGAGLKAVKG